jgi:hypothetical protein
VGGFADKLGRREKNTIKGILALLNDLINVRGRSSLFGATFEVESWSDGETQHIFRTSYQIYQRRTVRRSIRFFKVKSRTESAYS